MMESRSVGRDGPGRGPEIDRGRVGQVGTRDRDAGAASAGTGARADGGDRRCRRIGEVVGTRGGRGADRRGHRDVDGGRRFGGCVDRDLRRRHDGDIRAGLAGPKIDGRGAGEVGARDGHARGAAQGSGVRADRCDRRHCRVGELVGARGGRGATGRRNRDVDVPVPAGEVTVIDPAPSAVTVPAVFPNLTAVAFARLEPVTVTLVPPPAGPELGLTAVTVGAAV